MGIQSSLFICHVIQDTQGLITLIAYSTCYMDCSTVQYYFIIFVIFVVPGLDVDELSKHLYLLFLLFLSMDIELLL
jgi:hypothetical protein